MLPSIVSIALPDLPREDVARATLAMRPARLGDIASLVELENASFTGDRLTPRHFRHLLTKGSAACVVAEDSGRLTGYALVLFNAGTKLARLYSFAVHGGQRRQGIGRRLLAAAERAAREHGRAHMRLEVRPDNDAAIAFYRDAGYEEFGVRRDFYEDHADALRMEKPLTPPAPRVMLQVPYFRQTLDFTCGPSALMMAMAAVDPALAADRALELKLWRESTTIFMTAGHGGCGPYGLALAAHRRGFDTEIYLSHEHELFLDSVRSAEKKEVILLVEAEFRREIRAAGIPVHHRPLDAVGLEAAVKSGGVPVVLISTYRFHSVRFPHWLVVTGYDGEFIYAHDPLIETTGPKARGDRVNVPIRRPDFERMSRYGRAQLRVTLIIRKRVNNISPV